MKPNESGGYIFEGKEVPTVVLHVGHFNYGMGQNFAARVTSSVGDWDISSGSLNFKGDEQPQDFLEKTLGDSDNRLLLIPAMMDRRAKSLTLSVDAQEAEAALSLLKHLYEVGLIFRPYRRVARRMLQEAGLKKPLLPLPGRKREQP